MERPDKGKGKGKKLKFPDNHHSSFQALNAPVSTPTPSSLSSAAYSSPDIGVPIEPPQQGGGRKARKKKCEVGGNWSALAEKQTVLKVKVGKIGAEGGKKVKVGDNWNAAGQPTVREDKVGKIGAEGGKKLEVGNNRNPAGKQIIGAVKVGKIAAQGVSKNGARIGGNINGGKDQIVRAVTIA